MRGDDNWKLRSDRDERGRYDPEPEPLGDVAQTILDRLRRKMEQRKNEHQSRRDKADR